jgi:putative spermidine/putrescine transport system permease protein
MRWLHFWENARAYLLLLPALLVIGLLFGGGLILGGAQSLGYFPVIGLTTLTPRYYLAVLTDRNFLLALWLTFRIAFWATLIPCGLAVALALVLRERFKGSRLATFVYQIPLPIPQLVAANGIVMLVTQSGLLARLAFYVGLISKPADFPVLVFDRPGIAIMLTFIWKEVPFVGLVVLAILQSVGPQYEEIAQTLGATRWQRFWYVLLPLILPGLLSTSIIIFAFVFASYEIPLLLGVRFPTTLPVLAFQNYQNPDLTLRPVAMAMNMILAVIAVALLVAYRRLARYVVTS